jgi:hypothetical protein
MEQELRTKQCLDENTKLLLAPVDLSGADRGDIPASVLKKALAKGAPPQHLAVVHGHSLMQPAVNALQEEKGQEAYCSKKQEMVLAAITQQRAKGESQRQPKRKRDECVPTASIQSTSDFTLTLYLCFTQISIRRLPTRVATRRGRDSQPTQTVLCLLPSSRTRTD